MWIEARRANHDLCVPCNCQRMYEWWEAELNQPDGSRKYTIEYIIQNVEHWRHKAATISCANA